MVKMTIMTMALMVQLCDLIARPQSETCLCVCAGEQVWFKVAQRPAAVQIRGCVVFWLTGLFLIFSCFLSDRTPMSYLSATAFHESLYSSVAMGIAVDTQPDSNQEERQKDISEKKHSSDQNC